MAKDFHKPGCLAVETEGGKAVAGLVTYLGLRTLDKGIQILIVSSPEINNITPCGVNSGLCGVPLRVHDKYSTDEKIRGSRQILGGMLHFTRNSVSELIL